MLYVEPEASMSHVVGSREQAGKQRKETRSRGVGRRGHHLRTPLIFFTKNATIAG